VWAGGGSVWLGLESGTRVVRVDPAPARARLVDAGDGASGFATDGSSVWIVSHRDNALTRIDLATGRSTRVATLTPTETSAAERIAYAHGSLWITGRRLDRLRVDPANGAILTAVDIGPAGIEVLAAGQRVVVSAATSRGARRGDPIMGAVRVIDAATARVSRTAATAPTFTNGLVVIDGRAWTVDTVHGALARLALGA
jgi:streptogramin lyase